MSLIYYINKKIMLTVEDWYIIEKNSNWDTLWKYKVNIETWLLELVETNVQI